MNRMPTLLRPTVWIGVVLTALALMSLPTLLDQPAGGENPYMDDVGEAQVALNVWGTMHHTGYPLWTMLGNMTVSALRAVGVGAEVAPSLYGMLWGGAALFGFFLLIFFLSKNAVLAAALTFLLGLTRTVWFHNVVPEVYSASFAAQIGLILVAVWRPLTDPRRRVLLLALIGGAAVAHHRMVIFLTPGLIYAIWPEWWAAFRREPCRTLFALIMAFPVGLVGFLPYLYLPLRAAAGAAWVYGDPSTWAGFWHEFTGAEAAFLMRLPSDFAALLADVADTARILGAELTPIGALILTLVALIGVRRREGRVLILCAAGYLIWLAALHRVVMPEAVAMPVIAVLVASIALLPAPPRLDWRPIAVMGLAVGVYLTPPRPADFVSALTKDPHGVEAVASAREIPRIGEPVLMLPWGPRHTAVAFSKYVTGENADLGLVTHKADFPALIRSGKALYTLRDTFYRFPLSWWDSVLGRAYLRGEGGGVIQIRTAPVRADSAARPVATGIRLDRQVACQRAGVISLRLLWSAEGIPPTDYSVFVHLLGPEGDSPLAQADSSAPVYGWYPTSRWGDGEQVSDDYRIGLVAGAARLRFGLYTQPTPGQFVNYPADTVPIDQIPPCE